MRGTLSVRFSDQEKRELKLRAKMRGFKSVGEYIRYKTLGTDIDHERRIADLEAQVGKNTRDKTGTDR